MKMADWLNSLTKRERWLAGGLAGLAGLNLAGFIGLCTGIWLFGGWSWEIADAAGSLLGAIAAFLAIGLGFFGYLQSHDAQILEHQAYIRGTVDKLEVKPSGRFFIHLKLENYGRTPASNVAIYFMLDIVTKEGIAVTTTPFLYVEHFRNDFYPERIVERICETEICLDASVKDYVRSRLYKFKGGAQVEWSTVFGRKQSTNLLLEPGRLEVSIQGFKGYSQ